MFVTFDVQKFGNDSRSLTNTLYYLRKSGNTFNAQDPEIEAITCRTPSAAYKFTKWVALSGISPKAERVFLRNPNIGIKYLKFLRKKEFSNPDTQKRFWKKVVKNSELAYAWANTFNTRLSETEEEVFLDSIRRMRDYALFVIKGKFPEKIHNMIVLKSFEAQGQEKNLIQDYIRYVDGK